VAAGTRCFELLQDQTRVASSCGACHDCAREVFDSACARHGGPLMQIAEPQATVSA
jgi:bacterioferritin-associated ferredoxin